MTVQCECRQRSTAALLLAQLARQAWGLPLCLAATSTPLAVSAPAAQYYDLPVVSMRNVLWPLMSAGIEGYKVGGCCCCCCCCCCRCRALAPSCWEAAAGTRQAHKQGQAHAKCAPIPLKTPPCPQPLQPDKLENGEGHTSPLGIAIPGAEPGREWEYYYHDRWVILILFTDWS